MSTDLFGNETIRSLSWKQPYAELMFHGKIETRTYPTNVRGKVLICASKQGYKFHQVFHISGDQQTIEITNILRRNNDNWLQLYSSGVAVGIGELFNCRPMTKEDESKCFVEYYPDLWCWEFRNVQRIKPFAWKGSQGWSFVTEDQKAMIQPDQSLTPYPMKPLLLLTALILTAIITYHLAYEKGYKDGAYHQKVVMTEREGKVKAREMRLRQWKQYYQDY